MDNTLSVSERKMVFNLENIETRSPRLNTILMLEDFIKKKSGELKKTALFLQLPKRIMWGTFNVILKYLWDNNKIGIDKDGYIVYIWNPETAVKFINRKRY